MHASPPLSIFVSHERLRRLANHSPHEDRLYPSACTSMCKLEGSSACRTEQADRATESDDGEVGGAWYDDEEEERVLAELRQLNDMHTTRSSGEVGTDTPSHVVQRRACTFADPVARLCAAEADPVDFETDIGSLSSHSTWLGAPTSTLSHATRECGAPSNDSGDAWCITLRHSAAARRTASERRRARRQAHQTWPSSFSMSPLSPPLLETDRALQGACDSPAADMHAPRSGLTTVARQGLSDPNESAQTVAGPTETVTGQGLGLGSETYIHAPLAFSSKVTVTIHPDLCDVDCSTNGKLTSPRSVQAYSQLKIWHSHACDSADRPI